MLVHVVCVCVEWVSVWRGEGGGGSIVAQFYPREIVFFRKIGMRLLHVSFDEIYCTVIT